MKRRNRLHKPLPNLALSGLAATAAFTISGVASAGNLTPVHWVKDPIVQPQYVQNGKLRDNAPFLGIRTPKPNGGYTLNAICKGTDNRIYAGYPEYANSKWRVKCPANGEVINNPTYYTTESKATAAQRGNISALSIRVRFGSNERVLCYGVLGDGQRVPGLMTYTAPGQLPDKCYIRVMGSSVGLTNWGVFKYKHNPNLPTGNGWWTPGSNQPATTALPLYLWSRNNQELCRVKDGIYHFAGFLQRVNGYYSCQASTLNGMRNSVNFDLYLAHKNPQPRLSPNWVSGSSQLWSRGLRISDGPQPYQRVYMCQQSTTKKYGYVRENDKLCKVAGVNSAAGENSYKIVWRY